MVADDIWSLFSIRVFITLLVCFITASGTATIPRIFVVILGAITGLILLWRIPKAKCHESSDMVSSAATKGQIVFEGSVEFHIPIIDIHESPYVDLWKTLCRSLEQYRSEVSSAIQGLGRSMEVALYYEENRKIAPSARLSTRIQQRIQRLSECLDEDDAVLTNLLKPFDILRALPDNERVDSGVDFDHREEEKFELNRPPSTIFQVVETKNSALLGENAYDSAVQIMAHIVRDWSLVGQPIRKRLYDWCKFIHSMRRDNIISCHKSSLILWTIP